MRKTGADGLQISNNVFSVGDECSLRGQFYVLGDFVHASLEVWRDWLTSSFVLIDLLGEAALLAG